MGAYRCDHFKLEELVYPELFHQEKGALKLWNAFDIKALMSIDRLREFMNIGVTINNWHVPGGTARASGLRPQFPAEWNQDKYNKIAGTGVSQHKFGRAFDLKFNKPKWNPEKLREHMKAIGCFEDGFLQRTDIEAFPFLLIRRIEWMPNMGWFHLDSFEETLIPSKISVFTG